MEKIPLEMKIEMLAKIRQMQRKLHQEFAICELGLLAAEKICDTLEERMRLKFILEENILTLSNAQKDFQIILDRVELST